MTAAEHMERWHRYYESLRTTVQFQSDLRRIQEALNRVGGTGYEELKRAVERLAEPTPRADARRPADDPGRAPETPGPHSHASE